MLVHFYQFYISMYFYSASQLSVAPTTSIGRD